MTTRRHYLLTGMVLAAFVAGASVAQDSPEPRLLAPTGDDAPAPKASPAIPSPDQIEAPPATKKLDEVFHRSVYLAARRGAHWLKGMQRPDGLFVYGWNPALNKAIPGDNYIRQAGAAAGLARAAAVTQDPDLALAARQAVVVLVSSFTEPDPTNAAARRPSLPPMDANPVGFAALTLLAIHELPNPSPELVAQGDKLAEFLRSRQRDNGSINVGESFDLAAEDDPDAIEFYPGEALYAIARSQTSSPKDWKLPYLAKAFTYYRRHFKESPTMAFVPWHTAALAEAYILTREKAYAEQIYEMNDWLKQMQYVQSTGLPAGWLGGFASYHQGHSLRTPPGIATASYAEAMVEACRIASLAGDERRALAYRSSLELALAFLIANQYTVQKASHLQPWFARKLNGGFCASVDDGTLRIDHNQHALLAMLQYLTHVVETREPSAPAPAAN